MVSHTHLEDSKMSKVHFFDPHPGIGGAMIPLPAPMLLVAQALNGERMTMQKAITRFTAKAVQMGRWWRVEKYRGCIFLHYDDGPEKPSHIWRLIRFRRPRRARGRRIA